MTFVLNYIVSYIKYLLYADDLVCGVKQKKSRAREKCQQTLNKALSALEESVTEAMFKQALENYIPIILFSA